MKNISKILLLSTSCIICYEVRDVYASFISDTVPRSGIHIYTTQPHLTSDYPHLPSAHPRGVAESLPRLVPSTESAMLTSCLPQAQSGDRHNLNTPPKVGGVRGGVTSEASISLSSESDTVSLTGLIPPRELQPDKVRGVLAPPTQGEDNKLNIFKTASICFITDAGNCSGEKFSNDETPGNGNGNPGSIPDYDTQQEQCQAAGYKVTSCPDGAHPENPCPADSAYYQKCVCDANITETCTKPYYGVGPQCEGKYASCKRDDDKACKEDGYSQTAQCSSVQTPNKKCSYNNSYYDKCVCRSDLVTCSYPQTGVGEACGGKYASCQCPSSYKSCECGGAAGATSCTVNGTTTYSSCKECCKTSCPNGYTNSTIPNGYVQDGEACNHCSLGLRYKIKPNPCTGYQKCQFGPESGAKTCLSGSTTMYDKCRPCSNACPSGTSESNPGGCGGSTTNECGTKTCYYPYQTCCDDSCPYGYSGPYGYSEEKPTCSGSQELFTSYTSCGSNCYKCANKMYYGSTRLTGCSPMNTWEGASNRVRYSCHLEEECQCGDGPVTTCTATGQVVINTDYENCMSACSSYESSGSLKWTGGTC